MNSDRNNENVVFVSKIDGFLYTQNLDGSDCKRIHIKAVEDNINPPGPLQPVNDSTILSFSGPRWSPDKSRIAVSVTVATDQAQVIVLDADGGNACAANPNFQIAGQIDWSSDGSKITYAMSTAAFGTFNEIFITDLQTNTLQQLTHLSQQVGNLNSPRWSRDDTQIFFFDSGARNQPQRLYSYTFATDSIRTLGLVQDGWKTVTRTGDLVFIADSSGKIVSHNITNQIVKDLTAGPNDSSPRLDLQDQWLIFTRGRYPNYTVFFITPEGDNLHTLNNLNNLIDSHQVDVFRFFRKL